jgi:hypothetical protein
VAGGLGRDFLLRRFRRLGRHRDFGLLGLLDLGLRLLIELALGLLLDLLLDLLDLLLG